MGNKYNILAVWLASWFGREFEGRVGVVIAPQSCTCATRSTNQHSALLGQIVGDNYNMIMMMQVYFLIAP